MRFFIVMPALVACAPAPPSVDEPGRGEAPAVSFVQPGARDPSADLDLGHPRLEWPQRFVFDTPSGPPEQFQMRVRLERAAQGRLVYTVTEDGRSHQAMVEPADVGRFQIVSQGATGSAGFDGSTGLDGAAGLPGLDASCPSTSGADGGRGGDGESGGTGGPGGSGGDGGNILVDVVCAGACDDLVAIARRTVLSQGGPGGPGGAGGRGGAGGPGGRGGSGTTCFDADGNITSLAGGLDGSSGFDGFRGSDGLPGSSGAPGDVVVRLVE